jgi:hypothetical protein
VVIESAAALDEACLSQRRREAFSLREVFIDRTPLPRTWRASAVEFIMF